MATERIRYHLDEHMDPDIARALRRYGIDVTTTIEAGLRSQSDESQFEFARRAHRVLITNDTDVLRHSAAGIPHDGIAFCHRKDRSIGEIIRGLVLMYEVLEPSEMAGRVEFL